MRSLLFLCLFLGTSFLVFSQNKREIKEEAKTFFAAEHYEFALNTFLSSKALSRSDEESRFLIAICYYQLNQLEAANDLLFEIVKEESSPYPECWWYLGKIFHAKQQFSEAVRYYKLYLQTLRPVHPNRNMVIEEIRRCDNGLRYFYQEAKIVVENLGEAVNTAEDEFAPVLSPNFSSKLYFSSIRNGNLGGKRDQQTRPNEKYGHFYSDMYSSELQGGQWQRAAPMHYLLNSPQHERLVGFSSHGQVLCYYQGWTWDQGIIFADTFRQEEQRTLTTTPLIAPISPEYGDNELFIYYDTLIIFASRRQGGYGGLDIYRTAFRNGSWTTPENLGPRINSPFDETSPFLSRDGRTLYFSTNNSAISMGGLDIVQSVYLPQAARWSDLRNMGTPINSASDDAHFSLARDGFTGFFSSSRKDGLGQRDLYVSYFPTYRQEMEPPYTSTAISTAPPIISQPAPVRSAPASPPVEPQTNTNTSASNWQLNASSFAALRNTSSYNALTQETLNYLQRNPSMHAVISCYLLQEPGRTLAETLFNGAASVKEFTNFLASRGIQENRFFIRAVKHNSADIKLEVSFSQIPNGVNSLPVIGQRNAVVHQTNKSLLYKVQIVSVQQAYRNPALNEFNNLMVEHIPDFPYFRYTVGAFESFREANVFKNSIVNKGYNGAFVIPYLHGERMDKIRARQAATSYPDLNHYLNR